MANNFRCKLVVCTTQANPNLSTEELFDSTYKESKDSPVDEFLTRLHSINKLAPTPEDFDPFQGQLVLLGVVGAVESYFRTLYRRLIAVDEICQESVHNKDVSYGAAAHLSKELLPEAILERISFVSRNTIVSSLRELLGISGNLPPELERSISDYARVCQLRHCAVHRFGKLGANNAIALGLSNHKSLLEKPLKFDYRTLQNTIAISTGLVKTVNNFLFNEILSRLPDSSWTGVYKNDKPLFMSYYNLFAIKASLNKTPPPNKLYKEFNKQRIDFSNGS